MHQRGIGPNAVGGCMDKTDLFDSNQYTAHVASRIAPMQ